MSRSSLIELPRALVLVIAMDDWYCCEDEEFDLANGLYDRPSYMSTLTLTAETALRRVRRRYRRHREAQQRRPDVADDDDDDFDRFNEPDFLKTVRTKQAVRELEVAQRAAEHLRGMRRRQRETDRRRWKATEKDTLQRVVDGDNDPFDDPDFLLKTRNKKKQTAREVDGEKSETNAAAKTTETTTT